MCMTFLSSLLSTNKNKSLVHNFEAFSGSFSSQQCQASVKPVVSCDFESISNAMMSFQTSHSSYKSIGTIEVEVEDICLT